MTAVRKRKRSRRKKWKRIKRRILAWTVRILVLTVIAAVPVLAVRGSFALWNSLLGGQEAIFFGAKTIEETQRDPGALLIVLDAGHGGKDQGTCAGDILEKDINLSVVKKLAQKLEKRGAAVILTRDEDVKIDLEDRAKLANKEKADIFVSIHCNYYEKDAGIRGLECYYREGSADGEELAERILEEFRKEAVENRGTKTANYRVLRKTDMPAVLVELGYMSNSEECRKLGEEDYQDFLAEKIAEGIF